MAAETQYTANTGMAQVTTGNSNLDGSGSGVVSILTAASNGTLVPTITVKATGATTEGMIRIFLYDGTNTRLLNEIHVPANTPGATNPAFEYVWNCNLKLKASWIIKATTQNTETFNIIAEGLDWTYYGGAVRPESTNYTANTGMTLATTGDSSLTSPTNIYTVLTAGASASGWKGTRIDTINFKAIVNTTSGMIRLFLFDGTNTRLFREYRVSTRTKSSTEMAFELKVNLNFNLKADWLIKATIANSESIAIIAEANDWKYPS